MKYVGFLSASSLLNILNEKNLAVAKDQNPLSKLPGNTLVYEYVSASLRNIRTHYIFVYFDFDHFKPYNDKYGFRQGDRLILLFSDLLKKTVRSLERFVGHIGGDDFFLGICQEEADKVYPEIVELIRRFNRDVESFYDESSIKKGYIVSWESDGKMRTVPLVTVSAVMLDFPNNRSRICSTGELASMVEKLRPEAKKNMNKIHCVNISDMKSFSHRSSVVIPNKPLSELTVDSSSLM
jgi:diguanylate cyclase (GGDEF)-like protein